MKNSQAYNFDAKPDFEHAVEMTAAGQKLLLLPQRAVWWAANRTLFVADVHLGKAATFQRHAIPLPSGTTRSDLQQLTDLILATRVERLVILGDWLHAAEAQNPEVHAEIDRWRQAHQSLTVVLVQGNHDRLAGEIPVQWQIEVVGTRHEDAPFVYAHYPDADEAGYVLSGHLHPAVLLTGHGRQQLKPPCFWVRPDYMVLPAFGSFTGRACITPTQPDRVYVVTARAVLPLNR